jgi:hypothetical protein
MLLGSLTKVKYALYHLQPPMISPFDGYNVTGVTGAISNIREPEWTTHRSIHSMDQPTVHTCTVNEKLKESVKQVKEGFERFRLQDIKAVGE